MIIKGRAIKYGDDINTDLIIPGRYLNLKNIKEIASHSMEDLDQYFFNKFKVGDIIVVGKNFGCGSSREQAAICLKYIGVSAIIAKSFARIFFRNAINQGLPILESEEAVVNIEENDELEIDFKDAIIFNKTSNLQYNTQTFPNFMQNIIDNGGLLNKLKKENKKIDI